MSDEPGDSEKAKRRERRGLDPYNTTEALRGRQKRIRSGAIELFRKAWQPGKPSIPVDPEERVKLEVQDDEHEPGRKAPKTGIDPYNTSRMSRPRFGK